MDEVQILGSVSEAKAIFGEIDPDRQLTLIQALEQIYRKFGSKTPSFSVAEDGLTLLLT